jgi:hypothetical protein
MPTPSIDQLKRALTIAEKIQQLESELSRLVGGNPSAPKTAAAPVQKTGRRTMSAAVRAKLAAAAKARWARVKGSSEAPAKVPATARNKKRELTPEGRARIVAALKARWAAKRKAS